MARPSLLDESKVIESIKRSPKNASDIAAEFGVTERTAINTLNRVANTGVIVKERDPAKKNGFLFRMSAPVANKKLRTNKGEEVIPFGFENRTWKWILEEVLPEDWKTIKNTPQQRMWNLVHLLYGEAENYRENKVVDPVALKNARDNAQRMLVALRQYVATLERLLGDERYWGKGGGRDLANLLPHVEVDLTGE